MTYELDKMRGVSSGYIEGPGMWIEGLDKAGYDAMIHALKVFAELGERAKSRPSLNNQIAIADAFVVSLEDGVTTKEELDLQVLVELKEMAESVEVWCCTACRLESETLAIQLKEAANRAKEVLG